jgi:hypothetical protein
LQTALPIRPDEYSWESLFIPSSKLNFVGDDFKSIERIGGTVTHLESELQGQLKELREKTKLNMDSQDHAQYCTSIVMLLAIGVMPQMQ